MPVVLKSQQAAVVDALRAARNADDELSRIKENSLEAQRFALLKLVEAANWRYGPAELLATFPHHLVCKAPNGSLVQVEWARGTDGYSLGRATVHETATPVADLGRELMETARTAVDLVLAEDYESVESMIGTITEALDAGGDLQRRVSNEITLRSLTRNAWWHHVVGDRAGIEEQIPQPQIEGDDTLNRSVTDLLVFLKEAAAGASSALRTLANTDIAKDVETIAQDIAEDTRRAIAALVGINKKNQEETVQIYEAVVSTTPRLLNGIEFLKELTQETPTAEAPTG